jgi:hypothetical protein
MEIEGRRELSSSYIGIALFLLTIGSVAHAQTDPIVVCREKHAICRASIFTLTGNTVLLTNGLVQEEVVGNCPIEPGPSKARLHSGQMNGSCARPYDGTGFWSLYGRNDPVDLPVETQDWQPSPTPLMDCPGGLRQARCFGMPCKRIGRIKGVEMAECHCGSEVTDQTWATQSGQCDQNVCNEIPEGKDDPSSVSKGGMCSQ